jgi:tripeptidyl-peptidase-1
VALKVEEDRRALLEKTFWEVSDPQHEKYGQHLSVDDITNLLKSDGLVKRSEEVAKYFSNMGSTLVESNPNGDMLTVEMPASVAERALNMTLGFFSHSERNNVQIVRSSSAYHLPEEIAAHVQLVGELLQFPRLRLKSLENLQADNVATWPNSCDAAACNNLVQPSVLAERYKLSKSTTATTKGGTMAVAEFQGQFYKDADLKSFSTSCHRDVTVDKQIGEESQSAGVEAELDIEYIKAMAPELPLTVIYDSQYSLLKWANQITSLTDSPSVHSVSYGNDEIQQTSPEYMYTCNTAFMKAGTMGLSIMFASGDQGVCGRSGCGLLEHARFHPDFPAGSPYITSVGGTDFATPGTIGDETTWPDGGGGFSDTFAIPDFQKDAVAAYKASKDANLPPQELWNNTGRGYPDIAALGGQKNPYCVATGGRFAGVAGTSAACPVAAGIFAKLNSLRVTAGKAPLGFLNPFIYQNPNGFNDVTSGVNTGSPTKKYGFTAVKGWDAATGWGTPDFEALSKAVLAEKTVVV